MIRPVPVSTRNGYPETRPYVYRGTQHDTTRPQTPAEQRRAAYAALRRGGHSRGEAAREAGITAERTIYAYEAWYQAGRTAT